MVKHIVLLKFNRELTEEEQAETVARLKALNGNIPGLVEVEAGIDFSGRSKGFFIGAVMKFTNEEALKEYGPHPVHQDFVGFIKEIGHEDTLVVDFNL